MKSSLKFSTAYTLLFIFNNLNSINISELPAPYNSLESILPFDNHGWYSNATWISKLFEHNKINTAIEIGSWLGKSTRHIASLLPETGKLWAIDIWTGSVEHQSKDRTDVYHKLPTLYEQFLSNIIHASFEKKIIPIRMDSLDASQHLQALKQRVDLIYIDGAHDTQSVFNDLEAWYPYIAGSRGILCGDDWSWKSKENPKIFPVKIAVHIFAKKYKATIYAYRNFWFIVENNKYDERSFLNAPESIWKIIQ